MATGLLVLANTAVASPTTIVVTTVATGNPDFGNVSVDGYGSPWTTPILMTDTKGQTLVVFCDDLNHDVFVAGGQTLPYVFEPVTVNGLGVPLMPHISNEMGQLADIGIYDYHKGDEAGAEAAQAAIWGIEYGVGVSSTDPTIESDIVRDLKIKDNGRGLATGIVPAMGFAQQAQITGGVPEPATWAMMLIGFGGLGAAMRSRRKPAAATA